MLPYIKKYLLLLVVSALCAQLAFAQELYFKNLMVENGLSQEDVSSIVQDSFGFIWVGTFDGLNRFDGREIESFHRQTANPESLPDNRVSALIEDTKKRLWVGTQGGFFAYYELLKDRFIRIPSPPSTGAIVKFFQASDKTLYALTSNGILRLMDTEEPSFEFLPSSQGSHFRDALQKSENEIFFGGYSGIYILENQALRRLSNPFQTLYSSLAVYENDILAGGSNGLFKIDESEQVEKVTSQELPETAITAMVNDRNGNFWIGYENEGLYHLDTNLSYLSHYTASKTKPRGILSNTILEIYLDEAHNLWAGSRQGLSYANLSNVGFDNLELESLYKPNIRSLMVNGDDLLLGVTNEGLYKYNLSERALEEVDVDNMKFINHIAKIKEDFYVSSNKGLLVFSEDYKLKSTYRIPNWPVNDPSNIRCVAQDSAGKLYVGTSEGVLVKKEGTLNWIWNGQPTLEVLRQIFVFRMFFDKQSNELLVGTRSTGLFILKLNALGEVYEVVKEGLLDINGTPLSNTSVWSFHQSDNGTIWLGTDLGLFSRRLGEEIFEQVKVTGVLDKKIMSIAEDDQHHMWLSSTQGLIHFRPDSAKVKTFTYEDGLLSSSMTEASGYYKDRIFFGTTMGLSAIRPNDLSTNPYHAKLILSDLKINNETVMPGTELYGSVILKKNINAIETLTLNHLQNNFAIDFSATNYSNTSQNSFRYRLDGYNRKWIYTTSNPVISYSNLDPGKYNLEIQIEASNGSWTRNPFVLPIDINPAPWKTVWAYLIYSVIALSILVAFIYFWQQRQRLNHRIELDQIKITQDKELRDRQLRFFVDVGHEFKTPLSLILAPFNDLTNENLGQEQKNMCLQIVSRNIDRMNFLVHQLLDLERISEGQKFVRVTKKDLRQAIREYTAAFQWQVQHEHIDLRLNLDKCVGYFDRSVLEKGFYNVLSNAFKYTPNGGVVDITLKEEIVDGNEVAIIRVSDSGSGIPNNQKSHIFERFYHGKDRASSGIGLHLAHSLIEAHGGSISVEDSELGGAKFKIVLPIARESYEEEQVERRPDEPEEREVFNEESVEKGETILIVEDDHELRNYLNISLQNDYSILQANNGEHGLAMAQENLPDIIISDIMMPLMDGVEMCQQLKANNGTSHIPIIFLTAKKDDEDQKKGLKVGAWDYITKPFDSEALRSKVSNILETRNRFKKYLLNHNINIDIEAHYTSYDQKLLKNINQVIEDNLANPNFTASELASEVGLSRMHLHRKLKTLAGETAKSIITRVKIMYAVDMFNKGCDRVQEAMNAVGISNYGNFNNNFKKIMNVTATEYIANQKEENVEG